MLSRPVRIILVLFLSAVIIFSCTFVGTRLTDPATYSHIIDVLDENRAKILELSAASAVASAAISALPSDTGTPIAEKLSEFTIWFLLILSVVFLEKYLLTIFGAVACYLLIPVGCAMLLVNLYFPRGSLRKIGTKLLALSAILLLVIPTSVWISDQINTIYKDSIDVTIQSATTISERLVDETSANSDESTSLIDEAKTILSDISGSVAEVVGQFKNVLNRFIEATAVEIVTTCIVPVLVILLFAWLAKLLLDVQIILPLQNRPAP